MSRPLPQGERRLAALAPLHDRMPVIVAEKDWDRWLGGEDVADLLGPYPADEMEMWPVSTAVNKVGNEGEELWKRAG